MISRELPRYFLAQVHDAGEVEGTPYIASEYIAGTSLREHLEHQCVPTRQAAEISLRVSDALHHAHELVPREYVKLEGLSRKMAMKAVTPFW